mgnify:FL=1
MAFGDSRDVEEPYDTPDAKKFAEVYCGPCPVKKLCLEMGKNESFGVWGGKLPSERLGK